MFERYSSFCLRVIAASKQDIFKPLISVWFRPHSCAASFIRHQVSTDVLQEEVWVNQRWVAVMQDLGSSISLAWAGILPPTKEKKFMMRSGFYRETRYAPGWAVTVAWDPGCGSCQRFTCTFTHSPSFGKQYLYVTCCQLTFQEGPALLSNSFASNYSIIWFLTFRCGTKSSVAMTSKRNHQN